MQDYIELATDRGFRTVIPWMRAFKPETVFHFCTAPKSLAFIDLLSEAPSAKKVFSLSRVAVWGFFWAYNLRTSAAYIESPSRKLFNRFWNCTNVLFSILLLLFALY